MACPNVTFNNGAIFEVKTLGRWNDESDAQNVFQYKLISGGGIDFDTVVDDFKTVTKDFLDLLKVVCTTLMVWDNYAVATLDGNCVSGAIAYDATIDGDVTGDPVPPGVAALTSFPTGFSRVVLRKYWPGMAESNVGSDGRLTTTARTAVNTAVAELVADKTVSGRTYQYGYFSPKLDDWVNANAYTTQKNLAYQRRRRPGTGT